MKYFYKQNKELEKSIDQFFNTLSVLNETKYEGQLSVVLLGSLSRGEGTWGMLDGKLILYSDIEFFTVVPANFKHTTQFSNDINKAAETCFSKYNSALFHIDNTYLCTQSIPGIERKVLTYDAKKMGKLMFGNDCISLFPEITIDNINQEDIWDVMIHRMFYVAYYGSLCRLNGDIEGYRYSLAKNSLDLMTVILAKYRLLVSGFIQKLDTLKEIGIDENVYDYFDYCLSIKLRKEVETEYPIEQMEKMFIQIQKDLFGSYKIPIMNKIVNIKHYLRRRLGMLKRMAITRSTTRGRRHYFYKLLNDFEKGNRPTTNDVIESYVLNGYPTI